LIEAFYNNNKPVSAVYVMPPGISNTPKNTDGTPLVKGKKSYGLTNARKMQYTDQRRAF
jgi:hypothetical protein